MFRPHYTENDPGIVPITPLNHYNSAVHCQILLKLARLVISVRGGRLVIKTETETRIEPAVSAMMQPALPRSRNYSKGIFFTSHFQVISSQPADFYLVHIH